VRLVRLQEAEAIVPRLRRMVRPCMCTSPCRCSSWTVDPAWLEATCGYPSPLALLSWAHKRQAQALGIVACRVGVGDCTSPPGLWARPRMFPVLPQPRVVQASRAESRAEAERGWNGPCHDAPISNHQAVSRSFIARLSQSCSSLAVLVATPRVQTHSLPISRLELCARCWGCLSWRFWGTTAASPAKKGGWHRPQRAIA
jgi:hypothetical protein